MPYPFPRVPAPPPLTPFPRVLVENSEKLAVAVALHRLQAHQRDTHVAGAPPAAAALLLARLVAEAGRDSSAKEYEVGARTRT